MLLIQIMGGSGKKEIATYGKIYTKVNQKTTKKGLHVRSFTVARWILHRLFKLEI